MKLSLQVPNKDVDVVSIGFTEFNASKRRAVHILMVQEDVNGR
jgi:hypothetical protein